MKPEAATTAAALSDPAARFLFGAMETLGASLQDPSLTHSFTLPAEGSPRTLDDDALREQCSKLTCEQLDRAGVTEEVAAYLEPVINLTVDITTGVFHELFKDVVPQFTPPPIITRMLDAKGEAIRYRTDAHSLDRGRAGDLWLIMELLVAQGDKPFTVKSLQKLLDSQPIKQREKVVRTRLAELIKKFPGAIETETVEGQRHKRYRFLSQVTDQKAAS